MFNKKIIITSVTAIVLVAGISVFAISSQNAREEQKKLDEKVAMVRTEESQKMAKEKMTMANEQMASVMSQANTATQSGMIKDENTPAKKGSFAPYSSDLVKNAETGNVVLFFSATWCSTCQSTIKNLTANFDKITPGLTVLNVDFDKETALKQKYAVTMQHTFVKVDKDGNLVKKANGLGTLAAIESFVK